ncbi:uncharacterized protein SPAPADRAFT_49183 [Spathaspora passalidarum NRRL Y-27907]|uniref:Uncharacterized protein n=1 Tax=Spathaspora passalidarum (strain NRRL Y-27907 / 11-Y1) TaxID=619300 RepID=G3AHE9_SPAPN|nr:uncharacterized protein SPAPADRAFT_49183 [Spathaspora passalidarum NRRL Y-27907]EGW34113.1 hypothetical protein SPAPADRAFT_49183 [Spathaspora passalidarum NRRL Y-27907]
MFTQINWQKKAEARNLISYKHSNNPSSSGSSSSGFSFAGKSINMKAVCPSKSKFKLKIQDLTAKLRSNNILFAKRVKEFQFQTYGYFYKQKEGVVIEPHYNSWDNISSSTFSSKDSSNSTPAWVEPIIEFPKEVFGDSAKEGPSCNAFNSPKEEIHQNSPRPIISSPREESSYHSAKENHSEDSAIENPSYNTPREVLRVFSPDHGLNWNPNTDETENVSNNMVSFSLKELWQCFCLHYNTTSLTIEDVKICVDRLFPDKYSEQVDKLYLHDEDFNHLLEYIGVIVQRNDFCFSYNPKGKQL